MIRQWTRPSRVALLILLGATFALSLHASQRQDTADLRDRLHERYDILSLQQGIALVPREREGEIRIIEVRDSAVTVNGQDVTGRELRDRLGVDADLILRVTYLTAQDQRQLSEPRQPDAPTSPPDTQVSRRVRRRGDVVRIAGDVTVPRDERVEGDVVVVGGDACIDGEVDGEVTVVMGNANLGEDAVIRNDVSIVGGLLNRAPGARIEGSVDSVSIGTVPWPAWRVSAMLRDSFLGRMGSLAGTLLRVALLALFALVVVAFGRTSIERIADRTAMHPLRAGLVGFVAQLLFLPLVVMSVIVLAVSIVGIPLLLLVPFALFLVLIVLVVGFTGVAFQVGRVLNERFGWTGRGASATVILGVVLIAAVTVLARSAAVAMGDLFTIPLSAIGYLVEYAAWTLGLGAAILVWVQGRSTPPVLPS